MHLCIESAIKMHQSYLCVYVNELINKQSTWCCSIALCVAAAAAAAAAAAVAFMIL